MTVKLGDPSGREVDAPRVPIIVCKITKNYAPMLWHDRLAVVSNATASHAEATTAHECYRSEPGADRPEARAADRRQRGGLLAEVPKTLGDPASSDRARRDQDPALWLDRFQPSLPAREDSAPPRAPLPTTRRRTPPPRAAG